VIAKFRACVGFRDALPKLNARMLSLQIEYGVKKGSLNMEFILQSNLRYYFQQSMGIGRVGLEFTEYTCFLKLTDNMD
jgi:hypothetical protein